MSDMLNQGEKRAEKQIANNLQVTPELTTQGIQMKVNLGGHK